MNQSRIIGSWWLAHQAERDSMAIARWREYTIGVWIILTVIAGLILWYSFPFLKMVGTLIQLVWVVYTNEWTDGGF